MSSLLDFADFGLSFFGSSGKKEKISRSEYFKAFYPIEIQGHKWRAISWTTAASLVSVIEMVNNGSLKQKGFIKQEEIPFEKFLETDSGKLFLD